MEVPGRGTEELLENAILSVLLDFGGGGPRSAADMAQSALYDEFRDLPEGAVKEAGWNAESADTPYEGACEDYGAGTSTAEDVEEYRIRCEQAEAAAAVGLGQDWQVRHAAVMATLAAEATERGRLYRNVARESAANIMKMVS